MASLTTNYRVGTVRGVLPLPVIKNSYGLSVAFVVGDFDHKCQRLSAAHMQALNKRKDIFWVCQPCMELHCPDPEAGLLKLTTNTTTLPDLPDLTNATMLVSLEEKIGQLLEAQKTLQASFNNIQIDIIENIPKTLSQDIDSKIDNLQTKISSQIIESTNEVPAKIEASKTLANIINSNQSSSNAPLSVAYLKKAMSELSDEDKDKEIRSRGLVIYRAKEQIKEGTESESNTDEDEQLVKGLLSHLHVDIDEIEKVFRLGKFDAAKTAENKFRPIKVRLRSSSARDLVLKSLSKLKDAPTYLNTLSIRQDLNAQQRVELNEKVKEAYEKSKEETDVVYRVRGGPGNYRLIKQTKKNSNPQQ